MRTLRGRPRSRGGVVREPGDGAKLPLDAATHASFRARVDEAYERATCLVACDGVPEKTRNPARVLLASAAFKIAGLPPAVADERLEVAVEASARCLEVEPDHLACHLWHASARGIVASDSWNPLNVRLPAQLLAEFRAARGGAAPGHDLMDGAATRGETVDALEDPARSSAAIRQRAGVSSRRRRRRRASRARCRTGSCSPRRARAPATSSARSDELRATIAGGLPSCGENRYENALTLEEAARCLARLEAAPDGRPGLEQRLRRSGRWS